MQHCAVNHSCSLCSRWLRPKLSNVSDLDQACRAIARDHCVFPAIWSRSNGDRAEPYSSHAVKGLKNDKAASPETILLECLSMVVTIYYVKFTTLSPQLGPWASYLNSRKMPPWLPSTSIKGDKSACSNSSGISLLSVAGKVQAHVTLRRLLLIHVAETGLPESAWLQIWSQHSWYEYVACLSQEKCHEQHCNLFISFIDHTKAFVTVIRDLLREVLSKFGCTPHFLTTVWEFHNGMTAKVIIGGQESDPFEVHAGVKQACVLAPLSLTSF